MMAPGGTAAAGSVQPPINAQSAMLNPQRMFNTDPRRNTERMFNGDGRAVSKDSFGELLQLRKQCQRLPRRRVVQVNLAQALRYFIIDGRSLGEERELG